ncbi:MAG: putative molybdenum carrier protein [Lysobacterales bacterium]
MKAATRPRKPSSKSRRKKRRVSLTLGSNGRAPTLVSARCDGVETMAIEHASRLGLATAGFVPSGTRNPGDSFLATPTRHPSQALKWNVRAADVSVLITPDAQLYGRALLAQRWCGRYRKPWLHLHPAAFDLEQVRTWLRTRKLKSIHITGALEHQAQGLGALVDGLMAMLAVIDQRTPSLS